MTKSIKKIALALLLAMTFCFAGLGIGIVNADNSESTIISINKSAYVKIGDGLANSGLKFVARIEKTAYDELFSSYDKVEAGIIIVPESAVAAAGGYTFDKLSLTEGSDYAITSSYRLSDDNNYYEFDNAIQTIKDYNYNRNFVAAAFIKITDEDAQNIANFTYSNGAYYQYSDTHTANVYDIAYSAYEDRATSQTQGYGVNLGGGVYGRLTNDDYAIIKNYLDGVAVIDETEGNLSVKNGTYYQSPYTLVDNDKGDYVIDGKGVSATCFTYKNVRKAVSAFTLGSNYVGFAKSDKAVYNNDGSVKVSAGILGPESNENKYGVNENGYVGLVGNYGVGTYIETTFSYSVEKMGETDTDFGHDNIPQIVLFADEVNGKEWSGKGIVLSTGVDTYAGTYNGNENYVGRYSACGPDRMPDRDKVQWGEPKTKDYPLLTQKGLRADSNNTLNSEAENTIKTYKYVVGTFYNKSGNLVIRVSLLLKDGDNWTDIYTSDGKSYTDIFFATSWTASDVAEMGTNVILMAEHKGQVYTPTTTFTYSAPYTDTSIPDTYISIKSNGATVDTDGSLTMKNKAIGDTHGQSAYWAEYWNYYAYVGEYGVGYYLDFVFTGYQMPQLIFFADNGSATSGYASVSTYNTGTNSGYSTNYNRRGVVVVNGLKDSGDYIHVFGPNRMNGTSDVYGSSGGLFIVSMDEDDGAYKELTRTGQKEHAEKEYALTVGTFIGEDNKVWLEMLLKDNSTGEEVCRLQKSLGLTETEVGTGDIIILPPLGVDGTCLTDGGTSMVLKSFSVPYKKTVSSKNFQ